MPRLRSLLAVPALVALLALALAASLAAQSGQRVQGQVLEEGSGRPVAGAVVSLVAPGGRERGTLTDAEGRFSLRAAAAGRHVLRVERVGHRTVSVDVTLAAGETFAVRVEVPIAPLGLEGITVSTGRRRGSRCEVRPGSGDAARVWDEARKALEANALAQAEGRVRFTITQYERELNLELRLTGEERKGSVIEGVRPFESVPAAELALGGYLRTRGEGSYYVAPDAQALLSDEFLDAHCFRVVSGDADRPEQPGLVGLAFDPVRGTRVVDIRGTLWLDPATAELRHLDYVYTNLQAEGPVDRAGGRVEFQRLPTGSWIVRRWHIRVPKMVLHREEWRAVGSREVQRVASFLETGGEVRDVVLPGGRRLGGEQRATLAGAVFDSTTARPLAGASVFLSGTAYRAETDSAGRFRMEDLPEGSYTLSFAHRRLASLGVDPPAVPVALKLREETRADLGIPGWGRVLAGACSATERAVGPAAVAGTVSDAATGQPLPGTTVTVSWASGRSTRSGRAQTDEAGSFRICGVAAGARTAVRAVRQGRATATDSVHVRGSGVAEVALALAPAAPRTVAGQLVDVQTGRPVPGVTVRVAGEGGASGVSDAMGRVALAGVVPGPTELEVVHPTLGSRKVTVAVAEEGPAEFMLRLPRREYALAEITVVASSTERAANRSRGTARYTVAGEELQRFATTGGRALDLFRTRLRLSVTQVNPTGQRNPITCVEASLRSRMGPGNNLVCNSVQVFLDGVFISDPSVFLINLTLEQFASIEYLPPLEARARYGPLGESGVLLFTTRRGAAPAPANR